MKQIKKSLKKKLRGVYKKIYFNHIKFIVIVEIKYDI